MRMRSAECGVRNGLAAALMLLGSAFTIHAQPSLNSRISGAEPKTPQFITVPLTSGSTVQATNANIKYTTATFYGYSAFSGVAAPTTNAANASIGFATQSVTNGTTHTVTNMVDTVTAGSWLAIKAPPGTSYDLGDVYFLGTTGDKILIVYEQ